MNPVGSCIICGKQDELAVWLDPKIIASGYYPYHGVCFACHNAAQQTLALDPALPVVDSCDLSEKIIIDSRPLPETPGK